MSRTITDACELLEGSPQIQYNRVAITVEVDHQQQLSIAVDFCDICGDSQFKACDRLFEIGAWRRFCRAVQNSSTLNELKLEKAIDGGADAVLGELLAAAAAPMH
jgi:hypothetical protein